MGYAVEARDGGIGKVDEATYDVGGGCIVVDTGPWIFGKKVMLPAGVIGGRQPTTRRCTSTGRRTRSRTRPSTTTRWRERQRYRSDLGSYYGPGGMGYRDLDDR